MSFFAHETWFTDMTRSDLSLGVSSRAELVRYALDNDLMDR